MTLQRFKLPELLMGLALVHGCSAIPCNGSLSLCGKPITDVVFPATHNANSALEYEYSIYNANQTSGIQQQLQDGIRAMLLDVTYYQGQTMLCHGLCDLGATPHVDALGWIGTFLDDNPNEVLVLLYQDSISMEDMAQDFDSAGLTARVVPRQSSDTWPTLQELIQKKQQLLVTTEQAHPPPDWIHHLWDLAWDTPYSFDTKEEFTCTLNRGEASHPFFLMNHWLSGDYGLPSQEEARVANRYDVLSERVTECIEETSRTPNFLAVDWYEEGDLFQVVSELNEVID